MDFVGSRVQLRDSSSIEPLEVKAAGRLQLKMVPCSVPEIQQVMGLAPVRERGARALSAIELHLRNGLLIGSAEAFLRDASSCD